MSGVIYTRKSTVADGRSVADQERLCREFCANNGLEVDRVFREGEGISASKFGKHRPAWQECIEYLQPGHVLVGWDASRLTRDTEAAAALMKLAESRGVRIAWNGTIRDPKASSDWLGMSLEFLLADADSRKKSEAVLRGMLSAAENGDGYSRPPWPYQLAPRLGKDRVRWEIDPIQKTLAIEAARRVLGGENWSSITRWLLSEPEYTGPRFRSKIKRVMQHPAWANKRIHQGKVVGDGTWEPIVTEDQHRQLARLNEPASRGPVPMTLLSAIATCSKCGGLVRRKIVHGRNRYTCRVGSCFSWSIEEAEQWVDNVVLEALDRKAKEDQVRPLVDSVAAQAEIDKLKAQLIELDEAVIAGYSAMSALKIQKSLQAKIDDLMPFVTPEPEKNWNPSYVWFAPLETKRATLKSLGLNIQLGPGGYCHAG